MNLTRKDILTGIAAISLPSISLGEIRKGNNAAFSIGRNQDDNEMYKQMYLLMTTGVSSFGPILIDNVSIRIRTRAFSNMPNQITRVTFNVATVVDYYAFRDATYLEEIDLPVCTLCYSNIFTNCTSLKVVRMPNCKDLGANAFQNSSNVEHIYVNNISKSNSNRFPWGITTSQTVFHFSDGDYDYQGNKLA